MKIDIAKLDLQMARRCMISRDLHTAASQQTLNRIRRGEDVKPKTVGLIAKALDVDPVEIITKEEWHP